MNLTATFYQVYETMNTTFNGVQEFNTALQAIIGDYTLDATIKEDLIKSSTIAATKGLNNFKETFENSLFSKSSAVTAVQKKVRSRRTAFKSSMKKAKAGIQKYGTAENVAKASKAALGAAKGISKFLSARQPDGSIDKKAVIGGVLDVVDAIATFLPPPASIVTGISIIFDV